MEESIYTIDELELIFKGCSSLEEIYKACHIFKWLISLGLQQRSEALQVISLQRLKEIT